MVCSHCHHAVHAECIGLDTSIVPADTRWVCSKACHRCLPDNEEDGVFVKFHGILPRTDPELT
jgi:hypothetical protein